MTEAEIVRAARAFLEGGYRHRPPAAGRNERAALSLGETAVRMRPSILLLMLISIFADVLAVVGVVVAAAVVVVVVVAVVVGCARRRHGSHHRECHHRHRL